MSVVAFLLLSSCSEQIFIVGGVNNFGQFLNTAEIYNPSNGTFRLVSQPMATDRHSPTATTLQNSASVLVAGGQGGQALMSATLFQTLNQTFTPVGAVNYTRASHTATYLDPALVPRSVAGFVLIAGGDRFSTSGTAELYDPNSKTFTPTGTMLTSRNQHRAVLISHCGCSLDGSVLIVGGYDNQGTVLSSAEIYNPTTRTFRLMGTMSTPRFRHTATLLDDGRVLIAGGASSLSSRDNINPALNTAEIFDPKTGRFSPTSSLMTAYRTAHGASLLNNGSVLLTGGQDNHFLIENTAEIFNPITNRFTATATSCAGVPPPKGCMSTSRDFHISETLADGRVLIAGGIDSQFQTLASAELFDPNTQSFTPTGTLSSPRSGAASSVISALNQDDKGVRVGALSSSSSEG